MNFNSIVERSKAHFPKLNIKFKNESLFMKILGTVLFFNPNFKTKFVTTIGDTVYFPSETFVKVLELNSIAFLLHELVHIYDSKKYTHLIFSFLYLFPQSLIILTPLLLLIGWKFFIIGAILCLLPIPAYFRMKLEMRAYLVSLYVLHKLEEDLDINVKMEKQRAFFIKTFKDGSYYFMYPFSSIEAKIDAGLTLINQNKRPYEDPIFDIIDDILS